MIAGGGAFLNRSSNEEKCSRRAEFPSCYRSGRAEATKEVDVEKEGFAPIFLRSRSALLRAVVDNCSSEKRLSKAKRKLCVYNRGLTFQCRRPEKMSVQINNGASALSKNIEL